MMFCKRIAIEATKLVLFERKVKFFNIYPGNIFSETILFRTCPSF